MSDIGLRLDGVLVLAALVLAAVVYILIALIAGAIALAARSRRGRPAHVARAAALMAGVSAIAAALCGVSINSHGPIVGPDLIDWLSVPCVALWIAGIVVLFRVK